MTDTGTGSRRGLVDRLAPRYAAGSKQEKGRILDQLGAATGWHRDHARRALREAAQPARPGPVRPARPPVYGEEVIDHLRMIWVVAGFPCGKRLARAMTDVVGMLERSGALRLTSEQRGMLLSISPATIDRRLAPDRRRQAARRLALSGR